MVEMNDDLRAATKLVALAIALAAAGVFLTGELVGLLVGAPIALAGIFRAFGLRDPGDFF
jgi:hypothetical protein